MDGAAQDPNLDARRDFRGAGRKVFTRPALEDTVGKVIGKQTERENATEMERIRGSDA